MSRVSCVCGGLQLCTEPEKFLIHKLNLTKPDICQETDISDDCKVSETKECINGGDSGGGWSFLQALENPVVAEEEEKEEEEVYIHPMVKRSASTLSSKSLEMCTESLGSETGSDIGENACESSVFSPEKVTEKFRCRKFINRTGAVAAGSFPPPLTTISGGDGVQVRPHRSGGRLIISAVSVTAFGSLFEAERTEGRLRLSLRKTEHEVLETEEEEECDDDDDVAVDGDGDGDGAGDEVVPLTIPAGRCKESKSWIAGQYCVAIS